MKNILLFALLFGVAVTNSAQAQDGTPDFSFGINGVLTFPNPYSIQIAYGVKWRILCSGRPNSREVFTFWYP
jgi:hypothetical protein